MVASKWLAGVVVAGLLAVPAASTAGTVPADSRSASVTVTKAAVVKKSTKAKKHKKHKKAAVKRKA